MKTYLILWTKALFFLPGTLLHELCHYITAKLLFARVVGFSLYPKMQRDASGSIIGFQYGSVEFHPRIKVLNFIIGLSPMILWALLLFFLDLVHIISISETSFVVLWENIIRPSSVFILYVCIQLFYSGFPSTADLKVSFSGFFSLSGFIFFALVISYVLFFSRLSINHQSSPEAGIWL